jgi:hypothetical protein
MWFGVGGTLTTALCLGPWLLHVWNAIGSPFYPDFARLFGSPYAGDGWNLDRYALHSRREALYYPFVFARDSARVAEVPFVDWRIAAAYLIVPAALGLRLLRRKSAPPLAAGFGVLVATMAIGYALWLAMFAYYRYAVTLELLAPLAIALAMLALPLPRLARALMVGAVMLALVTTTRPADWGHLPWTKRLVEVSVPPIPDPASATILLSGLPIGYVVPSLPSAAAVINLDMAYWYGGNRDAWAALIRERLAARAGAVYAITFADKEPEMARLAAPFGLTLAADRCAPVRSNLPSGGLPSFNSLSLCRLARATPLPAPRSP